MAESSRVPSRVPFEARLPCPVCLGVQMTKAQLHGAAGVLVLDHCPRCGGVWFERGEVQQLARHPPTELWRLIPPRKSTPRPPCHGCHTPLDREAATCPVCDRKNELACPSCDELLARRRHGGLTLDVCSKCRGVWFDHGELRSLWSLSVADISARRGERGVGAAAIAGDVLLESLFWAPGLTLHAGGAAVHGLSTLAGAVSNVSLEGATGAAMGAAEVVGGAAESIFGTIMEIISSLFD